MNPSEYERMSAVEDTHWWYVGTRDLLSRAMSSYVSMRQPSCVLDVGCGTGANLRMLSEDLAPQYLGGFDISEAATTYAQQKSPGADVYKADLCHPEVRVPELDTILCCDVLYTTPLDAGVRGLQQVCQRLRPGGLLLLHVPALNWLKSDHDVAVHTQQRFNTSAIKRIITDCGLQLEFMTYRMFFLFPALVCRRLPSILFRRRTSRESPGSDLKSPAFLWNRLLLGIVRLENRLIMQGVRFPWGSSILAIGRKP